MPCAYHRCHAGHCGGRQAPASTGRQLRTPRRRTAVWWRAWRWCTSQPNPPPPPQPRTRHRKTRPWQRPGRISGIRRLCTCGSGGQGKGDWQWQSRRVVVAQTTMPRAAFTGITCLLAANKRTSAAPDLSSTCVPCTCAPSPVLQPRTCTHVSQRCWEYHKRHHAGDTLLWVLLLHVATGQHQTHDVSRKRQRCRCMQPRIGVSEGTYACGLAGSLLLGSLSRSWRPFNTWQ